MWKSSAKSKRNAYGVARIKRDTYNTYGGMARKAGWWAIRGEVWKRDGGMCVPCKRKGKAVPGKEVHHIIPLEKGGTTSKANLMTVCDTCHNARHNHLFRSR